MKQILVDYVPYGMSRRVKAMYVTLEEHFTPNIRTYIGTTQCQTFFLIEKFFPN